MAADRPALVVGVIDAFFLPSSRSMPRLLVPPEQVPRALASFQVTGVVFAVTGTAVGGVLVSWAGLNAAAGFDAITFGVMIVVLILLRKTIGAARSECTTACSGRSWPGSRWRSAGRSPGRC